MSDIHTTIATGQNHFDLQPGLAAKFDGASIGPRRRLEIALGQNEQ
jgi:hypothetical protein